MECQAEWTRTVAKEQTEKSCPYKTAYLLAAKRDPAAIDYAVKLNQKRERSV